LSESPANTTPAEALLRQALELASRQGALSWELRITTSLARLWREQDKTPQAHGLLTSVYERFTEGLGTRDLLTAKSLLDEMRPMARSGGAATTLSNS